MFAAGSWITDSRIDWASSSPNRVGYSITYEFGQYIWKKVKSPVTSPVAFTYRRPPLERRRRRRSVETIDGSDAAKNYLMTAQLFRCRVSNERVRECVDAREVSTQLWCEVMSSHEVNCRGVRDLGLCFVGPNEYLKWKVERRHRN